MFKLVLHISDLDKWPAALNNVRNTMNALQADQRPFEIAVIANAAAVKGYLETDIRTQISQLLETAINLSAADRDNSHTASLKFFACHNSLTGQDIASTTLNPPEASSIIEIVPVAIIALVEHQNKGFAYIKP